MLHYNIPQILRIHSDPMPLNSTSISILFWILIIQWPPVVPNPTCPNRKQGHHSSTPQPLLQWCLSCLPHQYCLYTKPPIKTLTIPLVPKIPSKDKRIWNFKSSSVSGTCIMLRFLPLALKINIFFSFHAFSQQSNTPYNLFSKKMKRKRSFQILCFSQIVLSDKLEWKI